MMMMMMMMVPALLGRPDKDHKTVVCVSHVVCVSRAILGQPFDGDIVSHEATSSHHPVYSVGIVFSLPHGHLSDFVRPHSLQQGAQ